jgi:hypothetical protein
MFQGGSRVDMESKQQAFRVHETVNTPNGNGVIIGRMDPPDSEGETWLIISHKPGSVDPASREGVRISKVGVVWDLWRYPLSKISHVQK